MTSRNSNYSKYFWDLNEKAIKETADILKDPANGKFRSRMVKFLSRCQKVDDLFLVISKKEFIEAWPKLRRYWSRIEKRSEFRDWWQTIYEELMRREGGSKKTSPAFSLLFKEVGNQIRKKRVEKGMSQKDLALAVGMRQPDISKIEEGKKNITLETLTRLCKCLGIEVIKVA